MITNSTLKPTQVIRYDGGLWRVEHVNRSRAFIVPLTKQHVVLGDREFDRQGRGVSIGTNSYVEVVDDLERARTELELAAAERELAEATAELERERRAAAAPPPVPPRIAAARPQPTVAAIRGGGWAIGPAPAGDYTPDSTKALVHAWVAAHPGSTTQQVAEGCLLATPGAVAACLDRFRKSGVVIKG